MESHAPDIAFFDIQMPLLTGLDVAKRLTPACSMTALRSLKAFAMTLTDDSAMAAAATTGDSSSPKNG